MSKEQYNPFALETKTIHAEWWPKGATVTIREISYTQTQQLAASMMRGDLEIPADEHSRKNWKPTPKDMDMGRLMEQTLMQGIESWTFPVPLNLESIKKLRNKDGEFIKEAIDGLNPEVDEDFQD